MFLMVFNSVLSSLLMDTVIGENHFSVSNVGLKLAKLGEPFYAYQRTAKFDVIAGQYDWMLHKISLDDPELVHINGRCCALKFSNCNYWGGYEL